MTTENVKKENKPVPLGLRKSFGFGDRLGLATPGHLASARKSDFAPIFAQQSIREMERTQRTPDDVMQAAQNALNTANFSEIWGADADHLKTFEDIERTARAGFCFFTIDPSAHVENAADVLPQNELEQRVARMIEDRVLDGDWESDYLGKTFEIADDLTLRFTREELLRAAVKYGRAISYSAQMAIHIAQTCGAQPFEIEVSVDETDVPSSALEHLFYGLELKKRGAKIVSLAPRFVGEMEKGIDYKGDLRQFENALRAHVAVARFCGPYKISVHSGSDKFAVYPIIGRICGDLLHVKTAGTSYLEALRVVARTDCALFRAIALFCHERFDEDKKSYHISTSSDEVRVLERQTAQSDIERIYLDERVGRQLLHVTFGSILTEGQRLNGASFKELLMNNLQTHSVLHDQLLEAHFDRHLQLLNAG